MVVWQQMYALAEPGDALCLATSYVSYCICAAVDGLAEPLPSAQQRSGEGLLNLRDTRMG